MKVKNLLTILVLSMLAKMKKSDFFLKRNLLILIQKRQERYLDKIVCLEMLL